MKHFLVPGCLIAGFISCGPSNHSESTIHEEMMPVGEETPSEHRKRGEAEYRAGIEFVESYVSKHSESMDVVVFAGLRAASALNPKELQSLRKTADIALNKKETPLLVLMSAFKLENGAGKILGDLLEQAKASGRDIFIVNVVPDSLRSQVSKNVTALADHTIGVAGSEGEWSAVHEFIVHASAKSCVNVAEMHHQFVQIQRNSLTQLLDSSFRYLQALAPFVRAQGETGLEFSRNKNVTPAEKFSGENPEQRPSASILNHNLDKGYSSLEYLTLHTYAMFAKLRSQAAHQKYLEILAQLQATGFLAEADYAPIVTKIKALHALEVRVFRLSEAFENRSDVVLENANTLASHVLLLREETSRAKKRALELQHILKEHRSHLQPEDLRLLETYCKEMIAFAEVWPSQSKSWFEHLEIAPGLEQHAEILAVQRSLASLLGEARYSKVNELARLLQNGKPSSYFKLRHAALLKDFGLYFQILGRSPKEAFLGHRDQAESALRAFAAEVTGMAEARNSLLLEHRKLPSQMPRRPAPRRL